jgi:hypothetical protein
MRARTLTLSHLFRVAAKSQRGALEVVLQFRGKHAGIN